MSESKDFARWLPAYSATIREEIAKNEKEISRLFAVNEGLEKAIQVAQHFAYEIEPEADNNVFFAET